MLKAAGLRKIFAQARKRVPTKIGDRLIDLTVTQALRLDELADMRRHAKDGYQPRYTFEDAAFRLGIDEDELLARAESGSTRVYTGIAEQAGRWMCRRAGGEILQSAVQTMPDGYLALLVKDVRELRRLGSLNVGLLELVLPAEQGALALPSPVLSGLSHWGDGQMAFRLEQPLRVDTRRLWLMAPLETASH